tara:strand:+ start:1106 stop:1465 length:360 start_codon:yes stop_codon:yes gene_type:complete
MKMILLGYAHTKSGPFTNLTNGKAYDHIGQGFSDDKGLTRLVSHFRWKVLPLGASYPDDINYADHISEGAELKDDDREEYVEPASKRMYGKPASNISVEVSQLIIARDILDALIIEASI